MATRAGQLVLRPSPARHLGLLAISIAFVAIGVMMIRDGRWEGWLTAGFFGLGIVAFGGNLIPGASRLVLEADGFRYRNLFRGGGERWRDIAGFRVVSAGATTLVGWDYVDGHTGQRLGRKISKRLGGAEAALPDTYGHSAASLASLMEQWRLQAVAGSTGVRPTVD